MGTQGGTEGSRAMREGAEDQDGRGRDDLEALHTPVQAFHVDPGASLHHDLVHSTSARLFSGLFQSVRSTAYIKIYHAGGAKMAEE